MWFPVVQRRPSLDASLAYNSRTTVKDGIKKLLCQCFETSSDRATVGSVRENDKSKPYVLLNLVEKEVRSLCSLLRLPPSVDTDCAQRRETARGPIDPNQFGPKLTTDSSFDSMDDLFKDPSRSTTKVVSSKYTSVQSSPYEDGQSRSTGSSRRGRMTKSDSLDDGYLADDRTGSDKYVVEEEGEDDEFNLSAKASIAYLLQQKDMKNGPDASPVRPVKDSKYNEPAPFRKSPPPMHSFEKHPFSKSQPQDIRTRKMSTLHLLRNGDQGSDTGDHRTGEGVTAAERKEYRKVNRVIRRLKKQLDPLNYTDLWFTAEQVDEALAFSNSVRRCIAQTGTFGHETERLNRWLNVMILEAREGPHRLEFQLIKYAHLDKMIEEVVEFKSQPPTLPFKELQMVEMASDLLRYWRHRFGNRYYLLDRHRQKIVMDTLLDGLGFKTPTPVTPTGWVPLNVNWMSEREAESEFEEGQW